jgi:DNA-3-methyladenine glycosylase II
MTRELGVAFGGFFSLQAAAEFGFGPNAPGAFDGAMRLAFAIDGGGYAGVIVRQPQANGPLKCEVEGDGDLDVIERQLRRVLSLDHDDDGFAQVARRDEVIAELQRRHPGQRPVLFHSPYEAAAWAILSARRPAASAAKLRRQLCERLGASFSLGGETLSAFPQPQRLLEVELEPDHHAAERLARIKGVAEAAIAGSLDAARLHALGPQRAYEELQELRGIGPFYASLITLRAVGFADAPLLIEEPRLFGHLGRFYRLGAAATLEQYGAISEAWRPYRTWAGVLVRLAGEHEFGRSGPAPSTKVSARVA